MSTSLCSIGEEQVGESLHTALRAFSLPMNQILCALPVDARISHRYLNASEGWYRKDTMLSISLAGLRHSTCAAFILVLDG